MTDGHLCDQEEKDRRSITAAAVRKLCPNRKQESFPSFLSGPYSDITVFSAPFTYQYISVGVTKEAGSCILWQLAL